MNEATDQDGRLTIYLTAFGRYKVCLDYSAMGGNILWGTGDSIEDAIDDALGAVHPYELLAQGR